MGTVSVIRQVLRITLKLLLAHEDLHLSRQQLVYLPQPRNGPRLLQNSLLYSVGTVSVIRQVLRISENSVRVMMEGKGRAKLRRLWQTEP